MKTNQRGFSLIEVLIALAIFAVAAAGLSASLLSSIRANRFSKETSEATVLAQDKIEEFRTQLAFPTTSTNGETIGSYRRTWQVSTGPTSVTRQVIVTVRWNVPGSSTQSQVQMRSILAL